MEALIARLFEIQREDSKTLKEILRALNDKKLSCPPLPPSDL